MSDPFVSIIMRSFNEAWALTGTLPALAAQDFKNWELIVIDSGSTDGSQALIRAGAARAFHPDYAKGIQSQPGDEPWMRLAKSGFGIFINADATPQGTNWLRPLVNALQAPKDGGLFWLADSCARLPGGFCERL